MYAALRGGRRRVRHRFKFVWSIRHHAFRMAATCTHPHQRREHDFDGLDNYVNCAAEYVGGHGELVQANDHLARAGKVAGERDAQVPIGRVL